MEDFDQDEAIETVHSSMSRILFITPKQPSTNPRMRKAADALSEAGHEVHVLYAWNADWATKADEDILRNAGWTHERIGGDPHTAKWTYLLSRIRRKWASVYRNLEGAHCRSINQFIKNGIAWQPDLVIGHNPGAINPTITIARKLEIPSLLDAEDFYRGETGDHRIASEMTELEDCWIPQFSAVTTASPLITKRYSELYSKQQFITVNNAFPRVSGPEPLQVNGPLKLIWFSQVIGTDRGLNEFINAAERLVNIPMELTLIGSPTEEFTEYLKTRAQHTSFRITLKSPIPEKEIFKELSNHQIGLALEPGFSENNNIARSNKLFSFIVGGCHIVATATPAQLDFQKEYEASVTFIDLTKPHTISEVIQEINSNRDTLYTSRMLNWKLGQVKVNWETESSKLVELAHHVLNASKD